MGLPVMDDDGEAQLPGKLKLAAEDRLLLLFPGVVLPVCLLYTSDAADER